MIQNIMKMLVKYFYIFANVLHITDKMICVKTYIKNCLVNLIEILNRPV